MYSLLFANSSLQFSTSSTRSRNFSVLAAFGIQLPLLSLSVSYENVSSQLSSLHNRIDEKIAISYKFLTDF